MEEVKKEIKIVEVDYGIANRFSCNNEEIIEVNKHLKKPEYRKLYQQIMQHELEHDEHNTFIQDLKVDLGVGQTDFFKLMGFMIKHPKSMLQFVPIYKTKARGWSYDINLIVLYLFTIAFVTTIIYISYHFL